MRGSGKKCKKPPFLGLLGQNGQFWKFLAKMGKTGIFFKKALGTFFSHLQALINCKVSEKSNATAWRTDARTDGHESLGLQQLRRETKNDPNLAKKGHFWIFPKNTKTSFFFRLQRLGLVQKISKF